MCNTKALNASLRITIAGLFLVVSGMVMEVTAAVAQTPPMSWNSYDCFNFSVTEAEVKANADTMAKKYKQYGWQYINIDWCWSFPGMGTQATPNQTISGGAPTAATKLHMDAYGRLMPDTVRHPSSINDSGFKPLAAYIHSKGLKFGIHLMRGIPKQAVWAGTPILGTTYVARDAADTLTNCPWLNHMFGLNMNSPAAQAYLNSIFKLYASWGVDFVKVDDMMNANVSPRTAYRSQIQGYRKAIDSCGREMVFGTSPGATPVSFADTIGLYTNQWRMADDLWDNWASLNLMVDFAAEWYPFIGAGHFPDADMIPIGRVSIRGPNGTARYSNLTRNQKYFMLSLWSICRSPLSWGGNMVQNTASEDSLMTNADVIAVDQNSSNNRMYQAGRYPIWAADSPDSTVKYLAVFNRTASITNVKVNLNEMGIKTCTIKNIWTGDSVGEYSDTMFKPSLPAYGSGLYKLVVKQKMLPTSYEAESSANTLAGTAAVSTNRASWCSGGKYIGNVGNGAANTLRFNGVTVAAAGTYPLSITYMTVASRTASVSVNGGTATIVTFDSCGSWYAVATKTLNVQLNAGANTIMLSNSSAYAPDIDKITVFTLAPVSTAPALAGNHSLATGVAEKVVAITGDRYCMSAGLAGVTKQVRIYNSMGKLIKTVVLRSDVLDMNKEGLSSRGVYILRIKPIR
jgi:hypothetical protein